MASVIPYSLLTEYDISLLRIGKHYRLYEKLGSHIVNHNGNSGVFFAVWAPNAQNVSVVGDFNQWNTSAHILHPRLDGTGIWEGFLPGLGHGTVYKYYVLSHHQGLQLFKGDPYARKWEAPPATASIVWDNKYSWNDKSWMQKRHQHNSLKSAVSVYELHLGSWKKPKEEELSFYTYDEIGDRLIPYIQEMGFTHVEFMPVMEHPYYPSWGYQICGFFAASSRFGDPQGLMSLIDRLHQAGIGVFLDWVPSHYPGDIHGLHLFDGTSQYEHEDHRLGYHPEWNSYIFNYGRFEVRSFLISNAIFWLEQYHADGLRVDAIASMIFLDYARKEGEWIPNVHGGNENLEAISFLKDLNTEVYRTFPDVQMIAEDSTAFPKVSRPIYDGGLGFGMKWMMGWMNDTLSYFKMDPIHRKFHHGQITFSIVYAWSENYMLPLSHDEVVHGKASLILKMPGDDWQKFAHLRTLYGYMFAHPGSKLLFMGGEIAQMKEWNYARSLSWELLQYISHEGIRRWVRDLNRTFRNEPALYELNYEEAGFEWMVVGDFTNSVLAFVRYGKNASDTLLAIINLTPVSRNAYRIGVSHSKGWNILLNSDDPEYWGSNMAISASLTTESIPSNGKSQSALVEIPPLATLIYKIQTKSVRNKKGISIKSSS